MTTRGCEDNLITLLRKAESGDRDACVDAPAAFGKLEGGFAIPTSCHWPLFEFGKLTGHWDR
jgi:hypothetical protein